MDERLSSDDFDSDAVNGSPSLTPGKACSVDINAFPAPFLKFLDDNNINRDIYLLAGNLHRFIRLRPGSLLSLADLQKEFGENIQTVPWLPTFYQLPGDVKIANTTLYKTGKISGIDVSSGAAVAALGVQKGDNCLDLCCAPGAKLSMLADLVGVSGTVTGVDVCRHRLAACRTVLNKYKLSNTCLYLGDGTTFTIGPPTSLLSNDIDYYKKEPIINEHQVGMNEGANQEEGRSVKRIKLSKRQRSRAKKRAQVIQEREEGAKSHQLYYTPKGWRCSPGEGEGRYDKVLVDAECTHDGSLKHMLKFQSWGWDSFERRFLDPHRIETITTLQRALLARGYTLLKPGGTLVY
eukprot:Ihof_evm8s88 gene=Ihof_evmTU8s88